MEEQKEESNIYRKGAKFKQCICSMEVNGLKTHGKVLSLSLVQVTNDAVIIWAAFPTFYFADKETSTCKSFIQTVFLRLNETGYIDFRLWSWVVLRGVTYDILCAYSGLPREIHVVWRSSTLSWADTTEKYTSNIVWSFYYLNIVGKINENISI